MTDLVNLTKGDPKAEYIFNELFQPRTSMILSVIFSVIASSINVAFFYGIIWFERFGTDNKRTLINKLVSSQCWSIIYYLAFCQMADTLVYIVGPFPESFCFYLLVLKNSLKAQILLFIDLSLFTQYLFIFWLKNPAAVNDDFWSRFSTIWISGFNYILYFVRFTLEHRKPLVFYTCANKNPTEDLSKPISFQGQVEVFSLLFYIIVKIKISFFQKSNSHLEDLSHGNSVSSKNSILEHISKNYLSSYRTNVIMLSIYMSFILVTSKITQLNPIEVNQYPNYLHVYFFQLISPPLIGFTMVAMFYARNSFMRETLWHEFTNYFKINH